MFWWRHRSAFLGLHLRYVRLIKISGKYSVVLTHCTSKKTFLCSYLKMNQVPAINNATTRDAVGNGKIAFHYLVRFTITAEIVFIRRTTESYWAPDHEKKIPFNIFSSIFYRAVPLFPFLSKHAQGLKCSYHKYVLYVCILRNVSLIFVCQ